MTVSTSANSKKEYLVPDIIEPEIQGKLVSGVLKVEPLTIKESHLGDGQKTGVFQFWCHSPRMRNNSLGMCNHSLGAVLSNVYGSARVSMLLECPKCRTSYVVTLDVAEGEPVRLISSKIVSLNRSVQHFVDVSLDSNKDTWIQIHEKK